MDSHEIWDTHSLFVFSANFVHANMISYGGEHSIQQHIGLTN